MKKKLLGLVVAGATLAQGVHASVPPEQQPSIVEVETFQGEGENRKKLGERMGFVFEEDGYILTAYRNLTDPSSGRLVSQIDVIAPQSGERYQAKIIGVEPTINLAIIKVDSEQVFTASQILSREGLQVGQEVYAATAFTKGEAQLQMGRLSGMNTRECYQESLSSTMMRAEMELAQHSIGSPVFNKQGEVVAIYTGYKPEAVEGHIENDEEMHILPSFIAMNIYESLKHKQSMKSPWTGFSVIPLDDEQRELFPTKHGDKGGLALEHVWPDSPADKLGIVAGDILVRLGHYKITSVAEFQKWLYMYGVGHSIKIVLIRDGEYLVKDYTIEERPQWAVPK